MNILYIINQFPKLSETFILNQIIGLIKLGHNVTILSLNKPSERIVHENMMKYDLLQKTIYFQDVYSSFYKFSK